METIEVRFQNILVGLHGYFVYTRRAEGEVELYDQYRAEALNPRFPREGTLIGQHFRMERGLTLSEVQSKRQDGYAIVAEGQDLLPIWVRIIDSVNRLNESPFVYRAFSNNSNAFINTALWRAGLPKVKPYKGFDEIGYAPGLDVLLDLRPLRKGEVDEKPEDRQLRIPDNRNTIRGNPSKHRHQPDTKDDRGAIDPAPASLFASSRPAAKKKTERVARRAGGASPPPATAAAAVGRLRGRGCGRLRLR